MSLSHTSYCSCLQTRAVAHAEICLTLEHSRAKESRGVLATSHRYYFVPTSLETSSSNISNRFIHIGSKKDTWKKKNTTLILKVGQDGLEKLKCRNPTLNCIYAKNATKGYRPCNPVKCQGTDPTTEVTASHPVTLLLIMPLVMYLIYSLKYVKDTLSSQCINTQCNSLDIYIWVKNVTA